MSYTYIDIRVSSFDPSLLERAVCSIMQRVDCSDMTIVGPIPLPTKRRVFTVNRSPHVNKNSREHFALLSHVRLLRIKGSNPRLLSSLSEVGLSAGVDVKIKVINS